MKQYILFFPQREIESIIKVADLAWEEIHVNVARTEVNSVSFLFPKNFLRQLTELVPVSSHDLRVGLQELQPNLNFTLITSYLISIEMR